MGTTIATSTGSPIPTPSSKELLSVCEEACDDVPSIGLPVVF